MFQVAYVFPIYDRSTDALIGSTFRWVGSYAFETLGLARYVARRHNEENQPLGDDGHYVVVPVGASPLDHQAAPHLADEEVSDMEVPF